MGNICVNGTVYVLLSHNTSTDHILDECVGNRWRFTTIGGILFTKAIVQMRCDYVSFCLPAYVVPGPQTSTHTPLALWQ